MRTDSSYDVVLVQPNITWVYDSIEHLGLAYLAASLREKGFRVLIVDAVLLRLEMSELYQELDKYNIAVLGVTLISHGYVATERLLGYYRERHPETKIIAGGHFATFAADLIFKHTNVFDAIALGQADKTLPLYCRAVLDGEVSNIPDIATPGERNPPAAERLQDMNSLPFPARDTLSLAMSQGAKPCITASRGCYARCAFCTVHNFYRRTEGPPWIGRTADNIIDELKTLHEKFQIRHFLFVDDNFMSAGNRGRNLAMEFAEAYRRSKLPMTFHIDCRANDIREEVIEALYEVGLRSIFVGIESVAPRDLIIYRKGLQTEKNWQAVEILRKFPLDITLSMIMFNPETDRESILNNIEFLEWAEYYPRNPLSLLNIYEGTDLSRKYREYLKGPFWDYTFDFKHELTKKIYSESIKFCKETLPMERELSLRNDGLSARYDLARLRLSFLKDVTTNLETESIYTIRARWMERVEVLRNQESVADNGYGAERIYMTGSPLDVSQTVKPVQTFSIKLK